MVAWLWLPDFYHAQVLPVVREAAQEASETAHKAYCAKNAELAEAIFG